jgi:hypothetical protein
MLTMDGPRPTVAAKQPDADVYAAPRSHDEQDPKEKGNGDHVQPDIKK